MKKQFNRNKKIVCSFCGKDVSNSKYKTRINYPFGRKSKSVKTIICSRCQNPKEYDKRQKEMGKIFSKMVREKK